jgi:hypothetical protein
MINNNILKTVACARKTLFQSQLGQGHPYIAVEYKSLILLFLLLCRWRYLQVRMIVYLCLCGCQIFDGISSQAVSFLLKSLYKIFATRIDSAYLSVSWTDISVQM